MLVESVEQLRKLNINHMVVHWWVGTDTVIKYTIGFVRLAAGVNLSDTIIIDRPTALNQLREVTWFDDISLNKQGDIRKTSGVKYGLHLKPITQIPLIQQMIKLISQGSVRFGDYNQKPIIEDLEKQIAWIQSPEAGSYNGNISTPLETFTPEAGDSGREEEKTSTGTRVPARIERIV